MSHEQAAKRPCVQGPCRRESPFRARLRRALAGLEAGQEEVLTAIESHLAERSSDIGDAHLMLETALDLQHLARFNRRLRRRLDGTLSPSLN